MTRKRLRRIHIGLAVAMLFFLAGVFFDLLGYKVLANILICSFGIVFLGLYLPAVKFGIDVNRKAWIRYKNKKDIFTDSILDDEEEEEEEEEDHLVK